MCMAEACQAMVTVLSMLRLITTTISSLTDITLLGGFSSSWCNWSYSEKQHKSAILFRRQFIDSLLLQFKLAELRSWNVCTIVIKRTRQKQQMWEKNNSHETCWQTFLSSNVCLSHLLIIIVPIKLLWCHTSSFL